MMKTLKAQKPIAGNSIQITGGEPMLRDDLYDLIKIMKEEGVDHIQLNTNGIKLALYGALHAAKRCRCCPGCGRNTTLKASNS